MPPKTASAAAAAPAAAVASPPKEIDHSHLFAHNYNRKGKDYDKVLEEWGTQKGLQYKKLKDLGERYKSEQMIDRISYYLKHKPSYKVAFEKSSGVNVSELKFRY